MRWASTASLTAPVHREQTMWVPTPAADGAPTSMLNRRRDTVAQTPRDCRRSDPAVTLDQSLASTMLHSASRSTDLDCRPLDAFVTHPTPWPAINPRRWPSKHAHGTTRRTTRR